MKRDFLEQMDSGRERAIANRNRGFGTGGKARVHARVITITGWEFDRANAKARWDHARSDAQAQYRFDVLGDQWEGL